MPQIYEFGFTKRKTNLCITIYIGNNRRKRAGKRKLSDTKYLKPGCKEDALVKFNEVWPHSP